MKNHNRNKKTLLIVPIVFLIVGIGLFIVGVSWLISALQFQNTAVKITGVITRIDSSYDAGGDEHFKVFVSYEYNGKEYENVRISFYRSSMYEGEKISLYCDPEDPGHLQTGSMLYFVPIVLLGMSLVFLLVGGVIAVPAMIRRRNRERLKEQGISLYATVEEIVYDTGIAVNNQHPFVIHCTYRDEYRDVTYRFASEGIWFDPSAMFPVGSTIEVKADANDYSRYYVNVEEAEKKVIDYT